MPLLVIFGGLPGAGKTTLARALGARIGAMLVRIDSIEQAILTSPTFTGDMADLGYRAAYKIAGDNLRLGHNVIADSVNPLTVTRQAWRDVAKAAGARALEIEVVCSDQSEHRRRIETRSPDPPEHVLPTWAEFCARQYEAWPQARAVDTAHRDVGACIEEVTALM